MKKNEKITGLSIVSKLHILRLIYRSLLFIMLLIGYIRFRIYNSETVLENFEKTPIIIYTTFIIFALEMIIRFFPSKYESPGCQKQFARNYLKSGNTDISVQDNNATVLVALIWIVFNGIFGVLYMENVLDDGIMILLCSFYSICDIICILFFCPFQTWLMKNKCCSTCRIYNWDYAMMFTPLFFVRKSYTWGLLILSVALLIRWEITFYLHPERFSENTNNYLQCKNCSEKLCSHKKQLHSLWKQIEKATSLRIKQLKDN
ncbi:MAG: hypothetical protein K6E98_09425 [Lachnospiraceae bacterium]|nr:hypothetical protein [Lachnospiraceae bacterium]